VPAELPEVVEEMAVETIETIQADDVVDPKSMDQAGEPAFHWLNKENLRSPQTPGFLGFFLKNPRDYSAWGKLMHNFVRPLECLWN
jgi:hypothetical protein